MPQFCYVKHNLMLFNELALFMSQSIPGRFLIGKIMFFSGCRFLSQQFETSLKIFWFPLVMGRFLCCSRQSKPIGLTQKEAKLYYVGIILLKAQPECNSFSYFSECSICVVFECKECNDPGNTRRVFIEDGKLPRHLESFFCSTSLPLTSTRWV